MTRGFGEQLQISLGEMLCIDVANVCGVHNPTLCPEMHHSVYGVVPAFPRVHTTGIPRPPMRFPAARRDPYPGPSPGGRGTGQTGEWTGHRRRKGRAEDGVLTASATPLPRTPRRRGAAA
ncbi:hypothetical protein TBS_22260 [Thermobispora bispora]